MLKEIENEWDEEEETTDGDTMPWRICNDTSNLY
jgi:hypothetical protein